MKSLLGELGVILIVGFVVLCYGKVCKAQCAWVLWEKETGQGQVKWEILQAFPQYDQCLKSQGILFEQQKTGFERIRGERKNTIKQVGSFPFTIIVDYEDDSQRVFEFKCFPDTIDPRK